MSFPIAAPELLGFMVAAIAVVTSPGPDTLLIIRNTLGGGTAAGFATIAGVQLGLMVHTVAAILGLSVLIAASPVLFNAVTIFGAAYLGWLGIQGLRERQLTAPATSDVLVTNRVAVRDALLCNVLNPKVILLFIALLPNFVDPKGAPVVLQLVVLGVLLIVINIIWQAPMALAGGYMQRLFASPRARARINKISGLVLIALAVFMLLDNLRAL